MSVLELSEALGVGVGEVRRALRSSRHIHNVGSTYPIYTWKIGNKTSHQVLVATIKRLISERPMSQKHLVEATGADPQRVAIALKELQTTERLSRFGDMWFIAGS